MNVSRDIQAYMVNFLEQLNLVQVQLNEMKATLAVNTNPIVQTMSNAINALIAHLNNKRQEDQHIIEDIANILVQVRYSSKKTIYQYSPLPYGLFIGNTE